MNVEDILRSHGLGVGSGVEIVESETEPTTGLRDGLFWYQPSTEQTKMYIDGSFRNIGGKGSIFTEISNQVTLGLDSASVNHGLVSFNKDQDLLFVYQGGIFLKRGIDYTLNADGLGITTTSGTWVAGTIFDFVAVTNTTIPQTDNLTMLVFESDYVVSVDNITNIPINISQYNPLTDVLHVYQDNLRIYKGNDWTLNSNNISIDLVGQTAKINDGFHFTVFKKMRDAAPAGTIDGATQLIEGSVDYPKLAADVQAKHTASENHQADAVKHITPEERTDWNAKETPNGAIKKIEQTGFKYDYSGKDANGIFTIVRQYRKSDGTLSSVSTLSGGTSPQYTTRTIEYYSFDGTLIEKTEVFNLVYDADGDLIQEY